MKAKRSKKSPAKPAKKMKVKAKAKATAAVKASSKSVENASVNKLQKDVAAAIAKYMEKEKIGFNELARRLRTSATQTQKIQKGKANLTMASVSHIAAVMKKKVQLTFV